jgi:hypothetical protein
MKELMGFMKELMVFIGSCFFNCLQTLENRCCLVFINQMNSFLFFENHGYES